ncbi:MAG: 50S ribosomal protein L34e [Candidatus Micrarchaeia archaeon]
MLPRFRSKSVRKIIRRTPKGVSTRFERKRSRGGRCALCGVKLIYGEGAKSKKKPSRKFGGVLCAKCSFEVLKLAGKVKANHIKLEDIEVRKRKFVKVVK